MTGFHNCIISSLWDPYSIGYLAGSPGCEQASIHDQIHSNRKHENSILIANSPYANDVHNRRTLQSWNCLYPFICPILDPKYVTSCLASTLYHQNYLNRPTSCLNIIYTFVTNIKLGTEVHSRLRP